mmetsp:Transcript_29770/g.43318  ORF Transcript_29770/g.43318 Transcript_29770/m.43318 type:complete len:287 (+) Transcript_29770:37-897(+)
MPRGYLKHSNNTNRKICRGGGSGQKKSRKEGTWCPSGWPNWKDSVYHQVGCDFQDFVEENLSAEIHLEPPLSESAKHTSKIIGQCIICAEEERHLIKLMSKCNHPLACYECLRKLYVSYAQEDVSNFPLKCFHPDCNRLVRETQLIKHSLVQSEQELAKYHRLSVLKKAYSGSKRVVHCPTCDHPHHLNTAMHRGVHCKNCRTYYEVEDEHTTFSSTLEAVNNFRKDRIGGNNGWANCPKCNLIISKGYGCDHMHCVCGHDFSWLNAVSRRQERPTNKVASFVTLA